HGGTILHPRGAGVLYHDAHLAAAALRADVRRDPGDVAAGAGAVSRGRSAGADRRALAAGGRELTICHEVGAELAPPMTAQVELSKGVSGRRRRAEPHPWPLSMHGEGKRGRGLRGEVSPASATYASQFR